MTPYFSCRNLDATRSPVILSIPHAGIDAFDLGAALTDDLDARCDADLYVDDLYQGAAPDAEIVSHLSRFVCDLNRDANQISRPTVPTHPGPFSQSRRAFVWEITTYGTPVLSRPLSLAEWQTRKAIHNAYHAAIAQALAAARDRFGFAILVDGHSMPSTGRRDHVDPGSERADIVPGDLQGTSCAPGLSAHVHRHFKSRGYSVAGNQPYKGGFTTSHHGAPSQHVHAIQIEMRRDVYMDENTYEKKPEGFARLRQSLNELLQSLQGFAP